jgi:hypothetical protein
MAKIGVIPHGTGLSPAQLTDRLSVYKNEPTVGLLGRRMPAATNEGEDHD